MTTHRSLVALAVLAAALATNACAKKLVKKAPGEGRTGTTRPPEPSIRGAEFIRVPELKTVRFEHDRYHLGEQARATLKRNADAIRGNAGWQVLVEGHCDDNGTFEYNLALGQKRAKTVRDYYLMLGIKGDRIATISFGEEKRACSESTESCRARNRRAETKINAAVAASAAGPKP
ncbi:MAG: OmpA family protein [Elusimicrobia bacterium]|nr:OmpA family protein [Elusimicrobiota bacterium]